MSLFQKINEYFSDHKIKLLCQIPISDIEYDELLSYAQKIIPKLSIQTIPPKDIMLSIALVQIAIRKYNDGNYWDYFLDELSIDVNTEKRNYLGRIFIKTLKHYGLFVIDQENWSRFEYVENIKAHAFVPNHYLFGYFDFLFSFYDRNLFRQITDDLEENIFEMIDYMVDSLSTNGNFVKIENSGSKPSKSYRLLKATKNVIAQCSPAFICNLISEHLILIDNYYYDRLIPQTDDRFSLGFISWLESKDSEINNEPVQKKIRQTDGVFYHKPYFEIDRTNDQGYLVIPSQKFRESEFNGSAYVLLKSETTTIKEPLKMYRAYGVIVSESYKIKVDNIFAHFHIDIISGSSRQFIKSEKEYILFDEDFKELQKLKKGKCYILVKKGIPVDSNLHVVYINRNHPFWDEYSFNNINDDSVIYINKQPISIAGGFSDKPLFEFVSKEYELFYGEQQIQTAYRHPIITFKVSKNALAGTFIWCNKERFKANIENISSIYEFENDKDNFGVSISLSSILKNVDGLYEIWLDEPSKQRKFICKYVLITSLRCRWEKPRFIFCDNALLCIKGNYEISPLNCERVNDNEEYILDLTNGLEKARFRLSLGGVDYTLVVPAKVFKYGFSRQWKYKREKYLWHSDLQNDLYISMPGATRAFVYLGKNEGDKIDGKIQGDGEFRFDIFDFVKKIKETSCSYSYINLKYFDNKWRNLSLFRILKRLWINVLYMKYENNSTYIKSDYEGKAKLKVRIIDYKSSRIITEKYLENGKTYFPELKPNELYRLVKYESTSDPFGFEENISILGEIHKIGAIDFNDLSNCKMKINYIICKDKLLVLDYDYTVRELIKKDKYTYFGKLTSKTKSNNNKKNRDTILFEKVRLVISLEDEGVHILSLFVFEKGDWAEIWYDSKSRKIISSADPLLYTSNDYNRFIPLYEDFTEYNVEFRRVK